MSEKYPAEIPAPVTFRAKQLMESIGWAVEHISDISMFLEINGYSETAQQLRVAQELLALEISDLSIPS